MVTINSIGLIPSESTVTGSSTPHLRKSSAEPLGGGPAMRRSHQTAPLANVVLDMVILLRRHLLVTARMDFGGTKSPDPVRLERDDGLTLANRYRSSWWSVTVVGHFYSFHSFVRSFLSKYKFSRIEVFLFLICRVERPKKGEESFLLLSHRYSYSYSISISIFVEFVEFVAQIGGPFNVLYNVYIKER